MSEETPVGEERLKMVEQRVRAAIDPVHLQILDESHRHRGHEGARSGGSHYRLTVVSERFVGRSRLARHRMLYDAVGDAMNREIHAFALRTYTPEEWEARRREEAEE